MPTPSPIHRRAGSPSWRRSPLFRWLRRPAAYWTVVALLAVVTVLGLSRQSERQQQLADTYGDLREVPVAVTLIRPGEALGDDVVRWEQRPATAVPAGTAVDLADGAVAAAAIYPGEVVHAERVAGSGSGLSGRLAPDVAAVSIPAAYGVPPVQPGDRVHLIAVFDTALGNGTGSTTPTARDRGAPCHRRRTRRGGRDSGHPYRRAGDHRRSPGVGRRHRRRRRRTFGLNSTPPRRCPPRLEGCCAYALHAAEGPPGRASETCAGAGRIQPVLRKELLRAPGPRCRGLRGTRRRERSQCAPGRWRAGDTCVRDG